MEPNKVNPLERLKDWLYESGFEAGLADKSLHGPLGVLGVSVIIGLFVMDSASAKAASLRMQLSQEKDREAYVLQYREATAIQKELLSQVILDSTVDPKQWMQEKVSLLAANVGIELVSMDSPEERILSNELIGYLWKCKFRGSFHVFGTFAAELENHRPAIGIAALDMVRYSDLLDERGINNEINATLFVIQARAAAGGPK